MNIKKECKYCNKQKNLIKNSFVSSNLNGVLPLSDNRRHNGILAILFNHFASDYDCDEHDYLNYIKENPGRLEFRLEHIGIPLLNNPVDNNELIIEMDIKYCPFCGRSLSSTTTDT